MKKPMSDRDWDVLETLDEVRLLTLDQMQSLYFDSYESVRKYLYRKRKEGWIEVIRPFHTFRGPGYWRLSSKSYQALGKNPRPQRLSMYTLDHQIGLNWIYCKLRNKQPKKECSFLWEDGTRFHLEFTDYGGQTKRIFPDAKLSLLNQSDTFLIEYDASTKSVERLRGDLDCYTLWAQECHSGVDYYVIYVVQDETRKELIQNLWNEIAGEITPRLLKVWTVEESFQQFRKIATPAPKKRSANTQESNLKMSLGTRKVIYEFFRYVLQHFPEIKGSETRTPDEPVRKFTQLFFDAEIIE